MWGPRVDQHLIIAAYVFPERMEDEELAEAQRSFAKPLHSHALVEVRWPYLLSHARFSY
jgi:hypothetical protein